MVRFLSCLILVGLALTAAPAAAQEPQLILLDCYGDALPHGAFARLGKAPIDCKAKVTLLALSPDGKRLAAFDDKGSLHRWDVATGGELPLPQGEPLALFALAFSTDGKTLVTAGRNASIQHWDAATGKRLREYPGDPDVSSPEARYAISADGTHVAASFGDTVRVWETAKGKRLLDVKAPKELRDVALSSDGGILAASCLDRSIRLWSVSTGKALPAMEGCKEMPQGFCLAPDGATVAALDDSTLCVWSVATAKELFRLPYMEKVRPAFSPNGKALAVSVYNCEICLLDAKTGREIRRYQTHANGSLLAFSGDGSLLTAYGNRGPVMIWDVSTGQRSHNHNAWISGVAFAPDGKTLATCGETDRTIALWDTATGESRRFLLAKGDALLSLTFSPDGRVLAAGGGRKWGGNDREVEIQFWNVSDGRLVREIPAAHLNAVYSLSFSPDGKRLASAGGDAKTRVWDVASGKRLATVRGHDVPKRAWFVDGGRSLLIAEGDHAFGGLALWSAETGEQRQAYGTYTEGDDYPGSPPPKLKQEVGAYVERDGCARFAALLADGKTLLSVEVDGNHRRKGDGTALVFWDIKTGKRLRSVPLPIDPTYRPVALSPDGKTLAGCICEQHREDLGLWDAPTGRFLGQWRCDEAIWSMAFSPDSATLATGCFDFTTLLWDAKRMRVEALWPRLGGKDGDELVPLLASAPDEAASFLRWRLLRAIPIEQRVQHLLPGLDDDDFRKREAAMQDLVAQGQGAAFALHLALAHTRWAEARRLLKEALADADPAAEIEARRLARAVAVLERAGTPAARAVLRELGDADKAATLSGDARAALERLEKKP